MYPIVFISLNYVITLFKKMGWEISQKKLPREVSREL